MADLIYRYRTFNKYSIGELVNSEFYVKLPNEVNDPFDSKCIFDERGTADDFRKHRMGCLKKQSPDLSEEQMQRKVDAFIESNLWKNREITRNLFNHFRKDTTRMFGDIGMVCFSKKKKNILMWSHYADEHKGFCVEFDRALLESGCQAPLKDMTYDRKNLSYLMKEDGVHPAEKLLLTKAKDWLYEKEVRMLILLNSGNNVFGLRNERFMKFPEEALTGIIFGCMMPNNDKLTIKEIFSSKPHKPIFYNAVNCENNYKLEVLNHLIIESNPKEV